MYNNSLSLQNISSTEKELFEEIINLFFNGDKQNAAKMRDDLEPEDRKKFILYFKTRQDEKKKMHEKNIKNLNSKIGEIDKTIAEAEGEKKELFQNFAKNPANLIHMTRNEPATKSTGISSFSNKLKRF